MGDWQDWKPIEGCLQPSDMPVIPWIDSVMINKTIEEIDAIAEEAEQAMSDSDVDSDNSGIE